MKGLGLLGARLYRRHLGRMLFFSSLIAVGVALLFGIENLLRTVERGVAAKARELLAADVAVESERPFSPQARAVFARLETGGIKSAGILEFASMLQPARTGAAPFLVSVKAVDESYPFYGRLQTDPPSGRARLFQEGACLIEDVAALQHGLKAGDRVRLGHIRLRIAGAIEREPDRSLTGFNLAPRLLVSLERAHETGLIRFGSRIRHRRLFAIEGPGDFRLAAARLKHRLESELDDPYVRVTAFGDAEARSREGLKRAALFFVLVSLVTLLLGAVGMAAGFTTFLNEQIETAAILRCLGVGPRDIGRLYLSLCAAVGLGGAALGALGGVALNALSLAALEEFLTPGLGLSLDLHWPSLAEGCCLALAVSLAVNAHKVKALSRLSPLDFFRGKVLGLPPALRIDAVAAALGLAALFLYARVKAGSWEAARNFTLSLAASVAAALLLILAALWALSKAARLLNGPRTFALRHGLLELTRRKPRSLVFLFSLSIGFSLLGALELVRHSLVAEFRLTQGPGGPNLFLVDVQKSQLTGAAALAARYAQTPAVFAPLVRSRITHINGAAVQAQRLEGVSREARDRQRFLTREQNLTYKDDLQESEEVMRGDFWKPGERRPEASLEHWFSERTGIGLGDRVSFDIQGRMLEAVVTSIRKINWSSARPNFFIALPASSLENAPQSFIASLGVPHAERSARFQKEIIGAFPNVSVIDISKVLENVEKVLGVLLRSLNLLSWFCVGVGLLALAGTLSAGHRERCERAALFRTLGLTRSRIMLVDFWEFLSISAISFFIAAVIALGLSCLLTRQLDVRFLPQPWLFVRILLPALWMPPVVGILANWKTYRAGVMENLRREL
ncbi:MAG: hypothetical protein HY611_09130 [Elusimicrobia bacterium]|nr:hypothetical protein [Elusimicrobiota bacterium]